MKWYFRYPIMIVLGGIGMVIARASKQLPLSEGTIIPQTIGDFADLASFMFIFFAGAVAGK